MYFGLISRFIRQNNLEKSACFIAIINSKENGLNSENQTQITFSDIV